MDPSSRTAANSPLAVSRHLQSPLEISGTLRKPEPTPHICVIVWCVSPSVTHHLMLFSSSSNGYHATGLHSGTWTVPGSGLTSPAFLQPAIHVSQDPVNCCLGLWLQFKSSWLAWLTQKCKALDCHFVYKILIIFLVAFHFITHFFCILFFSIQATSLSLQNYLLVKASISKSIAYT